MSRKFFVCLLVFSILLFASLALSESWNDTKVISSTDGSALIKVGSLYHKLGVKDKADGSRSVVDTLYYYEPPSAPEAYDDFLASYQGTGADPADTCINWYTLMAPGDVNKMFMQNYSAGTATWYIWAPAVDWDEGLYIFPDDPGIAQLLPAPMPQACTAQAAADQFVGGVWTPVWNVFDIVANFGVPIEITEENIDFWIGYSMDGSGAPTIWQDGTFHDSEFEGSCRSYSTLHAACETTYGCWFRIISSGNDNLWVSHMMQIEVEYDSLPPVISDVTGFSSTFEGTKTVEANIIDLEGETFTAELKYKHGINGEYESVSMSLVEGDIYAGDLTANVGDTIYYYVKATDAGNMEGFSNVLKFVRLDPPQNIPLILINDSGYDNDSLFVLALDNLGQDFYYWDMDEHHGIDQSVIHHPDFNTMIVFGWGTSIIPATDIAAQDEQDIAGFLESGGNLLLSDMDYLFAWDLPAEGSFVAGDFAYDYLGIGDYTNDPDDDGNPDNGGSSDIEMYGIGGDPITNEFLAPNYYGPVNYAIPEPDWANWGDFINPNSNALAILKGKTSDENMAVRMQGDGFKTVTFAFPFELAELAEFQLALDNALTWLGVCMKGDVVKDGVINVQDIMRTVAIILEYWTPDSWESCAADFNSDGTINVTDIVGMVGIILGKANVAPASQASLILNGSDILLGSDGEIGGLQFTVKSDNELSLDAAPGVEVAYKQNGDLTTVVVYSMKGALPTDQPVISMNASGEIIGDVIAADRTGAEVPVEIALPVDYSLFQNYPNPFNPTTTIGYRIPAASQVTLSIYNLLGQKVIDLVDAHQKAGVHSMVWDGKDAFGLDVPTGIYFYKMTADEFSSMRKMFFIK